MHLLLIHMTLCFFFKFTYHYQVPACNFLLITSFTSILTIVWNVPFLLSLPGVLVEQIYKIDFFIFITFKVLCDLYDDQVSRCAVSEEGVSTKNLVQSISAQRFLYFMHAGGKKCLTSCLVRKRHVASSSSRSSRIQEVNVRVNWEVLICILAAMSCVNRPTFRRTSTPRNSTSFDVLLCFPLFVFALS